MRLVASKTGEDELDEGAGGGGEGALAVDEADGAGDGRIEPGHDRAEVPGGVVTNGIVRKRSTGRRPREMRVPGGHTTSTS